jgi:hypothetical protein
VVVGVAVPGRGGEQRPEQHDDPADTGPAKEQVEQEDAGDLVAAVVGDDGGQVLEEEESGEMDHRGCL